MRGFALCLVMGFVSPLSAANPQRIAAAACQFQLPDDWYAIPQTELDQINTAATAVKAASLVQYANGYRRKPEEPFSCPYILVQVIPKSTRNTSYEDIERELGDSFGTQIRQLESDNAEHIKSIEVGKVYLDRSRNRIVMRMKLNVEGLGPLLMVSYGHLGADGLVMLHCYHKEDEFESVFPLFQKISDSFTFDAGRQFQPAAKALGFNWAQVGKKALIFGVLGGVVGGVLTLFRKKPPRKRDRRRDDDDDFDDEPRKDR